MISRSRRTSGSREDHPCPADRPNILLILTDQERATQHFPAGWEGSNLPTLTRLKRTGLAFSRAFCNACMCSPSRSTLFSGLYPSQHGVIATLTYGGTFSPTEAELSPSLSNLARMLWGAGYQVHFRGKWHLSKGAISESPLATDVATFGFQGWVPPDAGEDTAPEHFGGGFADNDGPYLRQAIEFLRTVDETKGPFLLVLCLVNPHDVLSWPNGYTDADLEGDIELPSTWDENLLANHKPRVQRKSLPVIAAALGPLPTVEDKLKYINFCGNLLKKIDGQIGQVIDALEAPRGGRPPLSGTTWVIRTSDHGEMGMAHGGLRQKVYNAYEESIRIPLVFSNPVAFPPEGGPRATDQFASLIDLIPTIAGLLGLAPPSGMRGGDLSPVIRDPDGAATVQEEILFTFDDIRANAPNLLESVPQANRVRCVREARWKYARYFHAESAYPEQFEMYDLDDDPDEVANLAAPAHPRYNDPAITAERKRLAHKLAELELTKLRAEPGT